MGTRVLRIAVENLARSLASRGAHTEIYEALHAAMPVQAERHLALFHGDRQNAGEFLMLDISLNNHQTLLENYLIGDASTAYAQTRRLFDRVEGAVRNIHRLRTHEPKSRPCPQDDKT